MLSEIKVWILVSIAGIMSTALGFIVKVITDQVIKRLDEIVLELKQLTQATTVQGLQIQGLKEQEAVLMHRINEHAERIRALEQQ
jgi:uncharacterized protein YoxC